MTSPQNNFCFNNLVAIEILLYKYKKRQYFSCFLEMGETN